MCSRVAGLSKGRGAYTDGGRTGRGKVKGADTEGHRPQPQGLRRVAIGASRTWWPLCRISGEVPPMISVCNSKGCFSRALPEPTGNLMSVHAPGCNSHGSWAVGSGAASFHESSPVSVSGQPPPRRNGRVLPQHLPFSLLFSFSCIQQSPPFPILPSTPNNTSLKYPFSKLLNSHGNRTQLNFGPMNAMNVLVSPPARNKFLA